MKTKSTLIGILIYFALYRPLYAQDYIVPELRQTEFRVMMLCPGISVEQRLSDRHSLNLIAGLMPGVSTHTLEPDGTEYEFYLAPFVTSEMRNYYSRKRVKKELAPNSGNYFGLAAGYYMNRINNDKGRGYYDESYENSYFVGPVWGFQRNYLNGFHLNLSIGLGYSQGDHLEGSIRMITTGGIGFYF